MSKLLIKFKYTLQKIILSDYNAARYVYTLVVTLLLQFSCERFSSEN